MSKITQAEDDKLYQQAMFSTPLQANYLGNPEVVGKLVADYCMAVREMLVQRSTGQLDASAFMERINDMAVELSVIFSGKSKEYPPIIGWNAITLGARIKVALGSYWAENHAANGDDPIRTLFVWLCWGVFDAVQRSQGDDELEGVILSDRTASVINMLLGTDRRV